MAGRMRSRLDADLLILGGGLAGLSLASALGRVGYGGRVQVLEPRTEYSDDRSWAFWVRDGQPQADGVEQRWSQWRIGAAGEPTQTCAAPGWSYCYVRSERVYAKARQQIAACDQIELCLGRAAEGLQAAGDAVRVDTADGPVFAAQVVDTRPPSAEQLAGATLFQVFAGRELVTDRDCFQTDSAELMTDLRCDTDGLVFTYVLPLTRRRALVEVTRFAARPLPRAALDIDLNALIAVRGWAAATVLRHEFAALPMGLQPAPTLPIGAVRAGVGGGGLRAAAGYGYLRIRNWAERCAAALVTGHAALGHPPEPALRSWMDALFLQVLRREPELGPELFLRLARGLNGQSFVRFMSDCASLADCARVMAALPPTPFLRVLLTGGAPSTGRAYR